MGVWFYGLAHLYNPRLQKFAEPEFLNNVVQ